MNIQWAMDQLRAGHKVRRSAWKHTCHMVNNGVKIVKCGEGSEQIQEWNYFSSNTNYWDGWELYHEPPQEVEVTFQDLEVGDIFTTDMKNGKHFATAIETPLIPKWKKLPNLYLNSTLFNAYPENLHNYCFVSYFHPNVKVKKVC